MSIQQLRAAEVSLPQPVASGSGTVFSSYSEAPADLWAITTSTACAENLPHGDGASWDRASAYVCPACVGVHRSWLQIFTSDGSQEVFRLMWDFADEKSINARFAEATASGESVAWTVLPVGGSILTFTGTWWFSSAAGSYPRASTAMGWSSDDGSWQARDGCSNGAGDTHGSVCPWGPHNGGGWGQGNWGARDAGTAAWNCGHLYTGSVNAYMSGLKSYLYAVPPSPRPQANEVSGSDGTACTNTCKGPGCSCPSSANRGGLSFSATCPRGCTSITIMDYANDGECDDGGPGIFLAIEHDTWCW